MQKINIPLKRVRKNNLPLPNYATVLSSGADLYADIDEDIILKTGQRALIPTGVAIALPDGFEAQVRSRSGLAVKNGIFTLNSPGTIDADYRGEIKIILCNMGENDFIISGGMRIAQLVVAPVVQAAWLESDDLDSTDRGDGGFGSTGVSVK